MEFVVAVLLFVLGLAFGSFLNVCVYRIPRKMSILRPPSHCSHCEAPIKFYDNIPLLSYLWLGGKCRACGEAISFRYPLVELASAFLWLSFYFHFGLTFKLPTAIFFAFVLLLSGLIDLEWKIIPNAIIFPSLAVAAVLVFLELIWQSGVIPLAGAPSAVSALVGFLSGGGTLLLVALASPLIFKKEGMGGGDIKLAGLMGIFLGWQVIAALFFGFLLGSLVGVALVLQKKKKAEDMISFGPFLSLGGLIALFYGEQLIQAYLRLLR